MKKFVYVLMVFCLALSLTACGGEAEQNEQAVPASTDPVADFELEEESGTTAMVDALMFKAKDDAETINEATAEAALQYIIDNHPEYYTDNKMMESIIYNGTLVEYYYMESDQTRCSIGMDAEQAVKYVYRGAETVEDDATQENLRQIQKGIDAL